MADDLEKFDYAVERHEFAADVDADRDLGRNVNVTQVPALFVSGKHVAFPYGAAELARVIDDAGEQAR
jgi:protein-disulfide isomerase